MNCADEIEGNRAAELLRELSAERAIRRLISLYCDAVSRKDPEAIRELFTSDAVVTIAGGPPRHGPDEIVAGLARTASGFTYLHQKGDTGLIDIAADTARCRNGVLEVNRKEGEDALTLICGIYEDEFRELAAGDWRFARRRFTLQFRAVVPALELQTFPDFTPFFPVAR